MKCDVEIDHVLVIYILKMGVHEDTLVVLGDGQTVEAKFLRPGDNVRVKNGASACIRRVIVTPCDNGTCDFVRAGRLMVTPNHKVYRNGAMVMPKGDVVRLQCKNVYSFSCVLGSYLRTPAIEAQGSSFFAIDTDFGEDARPMAG